MSNTCRLDSLLMPGPRPKRVARIYLSAEGARLLESGEINMAHGFTDPGGSYTVPFEPAVPRCRTCKRFRDTCCHLMDYLPLDGSGYCYLHEASNG